MIRAWSWWVARSHALVDARVLALVRILVCACIVLDLLRIHQLGLVEDLYRLYEHGGINAHPDSASRLVEWLGPDGGILGYWTTVAALSLAGLGLATRPMMVLGVLAYAQIGHLYNPGDRGIDRILRTVLVILLFSGAHRRFALGLVLFPRWARSHVPAWPADLLRWLMVLVYLSAGTAKVLQQPAWLGTPEWPVVYRIMTDPMAAHGDLVFLAQLRPLWLLCGWATIAVELSAPLLLSARWGRYWSLAALPMHAGIAFFMDLGMFSYGMMSLHVLLLAPWLLPLMDRVPLLRNPVGGAPSRSSSPTAPG